jgi:hypothetical protein
MRKQNWSSLYLRFLFFDILYNWNVKAILSYLLFLWKGGSGFRKREFSEKNKYMQGKTYTDFLLEINRLASKLGTLSENGSSVLQEWKKVIRQELSLKEYQSASEHFLEVRSVLEKIYDNLAFELVGKIREAEEFLCDEELDNLKKAVGNDLWQILLS